MVAGFSFIGEFSVKTFHQMTLLVIQREGAKNHLKIRFSSAVHYPDITSPYFATFLYVLLLQKVLSNQKQASNYHWRN